jgi:hypothetical protein
MNNAVRSLFLLAPLALAACTTTVIGGGTGGGGGDTVTRPTTGGSVGGGLSSVAMTRAQNEAAWDAYWAAHPTQSGSAVSSGGGGLDPNDLFLLASDLGSACGSPTTDLTCGGHWSFAIVLPPSLQAVGVYDLNDPALVQYSTMSETGQPYGMGGDPDCSWGGGSFVGGGTLEILSIDASAVHYRLTMSNPFEVDPSGEYTAPRCP